MATKKTKKEEDMICTGQSPFVPPAAYAMDVYQAYMQGVMNFWMAYSKLMTIPYWTPSVDQTETETQKQSTKVESDSTEEDSK